MKLKLLDLFSGIGGFSLGLESTGFFETIGFVEKDKFCQKVLKKHWHNINIEEDIRNVKGERYAADIITGGFPCQPFSVAGKRKSTADDRYLWDEMLRVIREVKPRWVIGENVEGIVNINEGMVLRQVLNDLENEGFKSQCIIIPASGIGAWHQRKRIWIVGTNVENSYSRGRCWEKGIRKDDNIGSTTEKQNNNIESSNERCGSRNNKFSINVPNSNNNGSYRSQRNETKQSSNEQKDRLSFRDDKDVPNSSSQRSSSQSIGVNRELAEESRREKETRNKSTLCTSSSCSDVSNSNARLSIRENKEIQTGRNTINSSSKDVSNSQSKGSFSTSESKSSSDERTRLDINEKKNWSEIWSYAARCNEQIKCGKETWWQTQSEFCGVPNGVSYELDKDRSNRIKALGNSIVPQIARQIGLSIMEAELGN